MNKTFGYKGPTRESLAVELQPTGELDTLRRRIAAYEAAERTTVRCSLGENDDLVIEVPTGGEPTARHPLRSYAIQHVPLDERGLATVLRILRAKRLAGIRDTYIGEEAAPTQGMIEAWVRQMGVTKVPAGPGVAKPPATFEALGLARAPRT